MRTQDNNLQEHNSSAVRSPSKVPRSYVKNQNLELVTLYGYFLSILSTLFFFITNIKAYVHQLKSFSQMKLQIYRKIISLEKQKFIQKKFS